MPTKAEFLSESRIGYTLLLNYPINHPYLHRWYHSRTTVTKERLPLPAEFNPLNPCSMETPYFPNHNARHRRISHCSRLDGASFVLDYDSGGSQLITCAFLSDLMAGWNNLLPIRQSILEYRSKTQVLSRGWGGKRFNYLPSRTPVYSLVSDKYPH